MFRFGSLPSARPSIKPSFTFIDAGADLKHFSVGADKLGSTDMDQPDKYEQIVSTAQRSTSGVWLLSVTAAGLVVLAGLVILT